jgi:hypothetical protein
LEATGSEGIVDVLEVLMCSGVVEKRRCSPRRKTMKLYTIPRTGLPTGLVAYVIPHEPIAQLITPYQLPLPSYAIPISQLISPFEGDCTW